MKESVFFSLLKERTSGRNILILRHMEWGAWGYERHTSLLPLNSVLVSLVRSRNSCGSWTLTKKVLPCFYNILTSRLLLSWLVGNTTLQGCTILLKPLWILEVNSVLRKSNCRWPKAQRKTSRSLLLILHIKCAPIPAPLENAAVKCCREAQEEASGPRLLWRFAETNIHMLTAHGKGNRCADSRNFIPPKCCSHS